MDEILDRSASLLASLATQLHAAPLYDQSVRIRTSHALSSLGMTHGLAVQHLIETDLPDSATVVLRAQYEATLRAVWAFYVAKDDQLARLDCELTDVSQQAASGLPLAREMLDALHGRAPLGAYQSLANFHANSWRPLNSFVHSGIHAVQRHSQGYPREILSAIVKHSNGLTVIAATQAAALTGQEKILRDVEQHRTLFQDCLTL